MANAASEDWSPVIIQILDLVTTNGNIKFQNQSSQLTGFRARFHVCYLFSCIGEHIIEIVFYHYHCFCQTLMMLCQIGSGIFEFYLENQDTNFYSLKIPNYIFAILANLHYSWCRQCIHPLGLGFVQKFHLTPKSLDFVEFAIDFQLV